MATWTQVAANIYNGGLVMDLVADDRFIYYNAGNEMYRFDTRHDESEQISNSTSFDGGTARGGPDNTIGAGVAIFKGRIYCVVWDSPNSLFEIWRWVSGVAWERVFQKTGTDLILRFLQANGRVITAVAESDSGSESNPVWYSKNGNDWVQTTIPTTIGGAGAFASVASNSRQGNQRGIFMTAGPSDGSDYATYIFDETLLSWQRVLDGTEYQGSSKNWHWRQVSAGVHYQFSASFGNWRNPSDKAIEPFLQYRMPQDVGFKEVSGDFEIYLWDNVAEDWEGSPEDTIPDIDDDGGIVRMPNQEVYLFLRDSSNNNEVWKRDEPLPGAFQTEGEVTLFHGDNELLEKATYQFVGINPGNMALTKTRTVYAGSSVAGAVMMEKAEEVDDYITADDATDGLDTSEGINAVSKV